MAKRRHKNRTHVKPSEEELKQIPKSMVIRVGQTSLSNHSLNQLVKDFRMIMQPHTAVRLKERKSNKLKDFVVMCGPLGVSHLFIFTQSEKTGNVSLKVARTPQGPTVTFQVLDYSLGKDIKRFLKHPKSLGKDDILNPPLLVLNGFDIKNEDEGRANVEKVVVSMFQNIFPPLNPARTQLSSIRRVFMINKDQETGELSLRHYAIDIRQVDISRNLKRLYRSKNKLNKSVPNLHKKDDIASLILDHDVGAYTSESEVDDDAIVRIIDQRDTRVAAKEPVAANGEEDGDVDMEDAQDDDVEEPALEDDTPQPKKRAIKLTEVGPRLTLKLVKIEEGICSGKVLHHEYVQKTDAEIRALEKRHAQKLKLKEQRRKEQEENIARKKAVKDAKKQRKLERRKLRETAPEGEKPAESSADDSSSEDDYSDVPEDLDSDLFSEVDN
ncbi:AAL040Wp [Eremothecium gossypii ATCC 10895]|uniref:AAL040Wp n=1 Tax=Eremothecium gossypii (strain ATCC 10895 / CBS 109.51 / FGSC 9923 / NRRL Y-1056) TaxID=284811 RepID=Q75EW8_EREGS|nr:AAL040Wp [Eremothecium gossypii ATCC 10895]AAS50326.1 AAL040Wp [Eremothecium gossypii ATCC 10895]AEY94612.1 FAAL040Wp [Eremothecium gossypii FDAG1]